MFMSAFAHFKMCCNKIRDQMSCQISNRTT